MIIQGGGVIYSDFSKVGRIRGRRDKHLNQENGLYKRNQIYVEDENYDFVYNYIASRCPFAKTD